MNPSNPCRFFLKGCCNYGDQCKFYHPQQTGSSFGQGNVFARTQQNYGGGQHNYNRGQQSYGGGQQNYSGGQQNYGGYNQQAQRHRNKIDDNLAAIEEIVKKDMTEWEAGGIWPLSVYSPLSKTNLPGFEDLSYEELRYATLQNNGQPPLDFQNKLGTWNTSRLNYQRSSPENRALLEAISLGKPIPSQHQQQQQGISPFGSSQPQTSSIFGGGSNSFASATSVSSSPFGSSLSVSKPFGQAGFTSNTPVNPVQPSYGAFGTTNTSSMEMNSGGSTLASFSFGQALSQTQSSFNQGGFNNQGQNLMQPQTQQQPQQQSVFSSPFSFQSNQIPQQQQQFTSNINPANGIFGQQQQPTQSTFPQMSPFGQPQLQQQQQHPFQQQQPLMNTNAFVTNVTSFGGGGDSMQDDLTVYSKESDLSVEDMQAFEAHSFDINTLPLNAPPKRLCL